MPNRPAMTLTQLLSAGADGLLKLWGVRNAECLSTFDEHEGKVREPMRSGPQQSHPFLSDGPAHVCCFHHRQDNSRRFVHGVFSGSCWSHGVKKSVDHMQRAYPG